VFGRVGGDRRPEGDAFEVPCDIDWLGDMVVHPSEPARFKVFGDGYHFAEDDRIVERRSYHDVPPPPRYEYVYRSYEVQTPPPRYGYGYRTYYAPPPSTPAYDHRRWHHHHHDDDDDDDEF
jgi:hypothetical protein